MHLHTMGVTLVGERVYFTSYDFNALFCMDLKEQQIEYKTYFNAFAKHRGALYVNHILYQNKIYLIPWIGNKIAIYDLADEKIAYIETGCTGYGLFMDAFVESGYLLLLYSKYPYNILKVNLSTSQCEMINVEQQYTDEMTKGCVQKLLDAGQMSMLTRAKRIGDNWWFFTAMQGYLLVYNWRKSRLKVLSFQEFGEKSFLGDVQEKIWMIACDGKRILEYDYEKETRKWIEVPELNQFPAPIVNVIEFGELLFIIKKNGLVILKKSTYETRCYRFSTEKILVDYVYYNNSLIFFPQRGSNLIVFNLSDDEIHEFEFEWKEELTREKWEELFSRCVNERVCGLDDFVKKLTRVEKQNNDQIAGQQIWERLRTICFD